MRNLPARAHSLKIIQEHLSAYVDELGVSESASIIGVSNDTMRRRIRREQPWFFEEILDLARDELSKKHHPQIADALITALSGVVEHDFRPLRIPSELREVLRLVGRLTTDIAETLDDGKVDEAEAANLLELLIQLNELSGQVRHQLKALVKSAAL